MPTNPGDPEHNDEQNLGPDDAETIAAEAAETQGINEEADEVTTEPDPSPFGEDADAGDIDPAAVDAAPSERRSAEDALLDDAAADARVDEAEAATAAGAESDGSVDLEAQLTERTEDLKRVSAEYANYRRRTEREREATITSAKASVMTQLLPILDDLDLAEQHGDLADGPLKSIGDKLVATLTGLKLGSFGHEGEPFDPEIHEAVQDLSTGDTKIVGTVLRKGYRVSDRVIRSAMVIIADPAE